MKVFKSSLLYMYFLCVRFGGIMAQEPKSCVNRFEYEYQVLQKILNLEDKLSKQESVIAQLKTSLTESEASLNGLRRIVANTAETADGNTYIRWGRTVCPDGADLVYHGYAAGSGHTQTGSGSNRLCLPTDPLWKNIVPGFQSAGRLFGGEYELSEHPFWKHLHDQDIPCAVCRVPRSTVLMIPGRFECYENFTLEYSGYLMSEYYYHPSSGDYVCVDGDPEIIKGGGSSQNGALFYLVESTCGALPCPPYKDGQEITCVVCSYSPAVNVTSGKV